MCIGTQMAKRLVDMSRKAGMKTSELRVSSTNPEAHLLYEQLGFKNAGVVEKAIRRGGESIDLLMMTRRL
jgi:L-amino acid N-acyltransferase YncA